MPKRRNTYQYFCPQTLRVFLHVTLIYFVLWINLIKFSFLYNLVRAIINPYMAIYQTLSGSPIDNNNNINIRIGTACIGV